MCVTGYIKALSSRLSSLEFALPLFCQRRGFYFQMTFMSSSLLIRKIFINFCLADFSISDAHFPSQQAGNYSLVFHSNLFCHDFIKIHIMTENYLFAYCVCVCLCVCVIGRRRLSCF